MRSHYLRCAWILFDLTVLVWYMLETPGGERWQNLLAGFAVGGLVYRSILWTEQEARNGRSTS